MLFNSLPFLFVFLPVLLVVFFRLGKSDQRMAGVWLVLGSLFFYGWWNPVYVALLLGSVVFNYMVGVRLAHGNDLGSARRKRLLAFGVGVDLAVLAYFKYANFFVDTANALGGSAWQLGEIVLPLGISFFSFTQIAFLADAAAGKASEFNFLRYCLFVTYFPHLIAGPVLHHKEMMPQFSLAKVYRFSYESMVVGLTVFAFGLFKKTVLADSVAGYAANLFAAAEAGDMPALFQAWGGALAYTFQLYFDFSGYSDMAIGLSFMIGVRLPLNFNSPYQAADISEFWRRWHMTLSRFLRDYLYVPLGGNRKGTARRYANLMLTMLLGGLWHGAGWNFVLWGGLHGIYLVIHHAWRHLWHGKRNDDRPSQLGRVAGIALTFIAVVAAWVPFRAHSLHGASAVLAGMAGLNGVSIPSGIVARMGQVSAWLVQAGILVTPGGGREILMNYLWIAVLLPVVFVAPNTQAIMRNFQPALDKQEGKAYAGMRWSAGKPWLAAMTLAAAAALLSLTHPSEFLYYQF